MSSTSGGDEFFSEEFIVWYVMTRCAAVIFVYLWMLSHYSLAVFFFSHRLNFFWNDQKNVSQFSHNVQKGRLVNIASFITIIGQMTKMFQQKKDSLEIERSQIRSFDFNLNAPQRLLLQAPCMRQVLLAWIHQNIRVLSTKISECFKTWGCYPCTVTLLRWCLGKTFNFNKGCLNKVSANTRPWPGVSAWGLCCQVVQEARLNFSKTWYVLINSPCFPLCGKSHSCPMARFHDSKTVCTVRLMQKYQRLQQLVNLHAPNILYFIEGWSAKNARFKAVRSAKKVVHTWSKQSCWN